MDVSNEWKCCREKEILLFPFTFLKIDKVEINTGNQNDKHYIYNEQILPNKNINKNYAVEQKCEGGQINDKKIQNKNKSIYNKKNNNFKENKQLADAGYNDTINNKDEPISYRGDVKIKGKRRILSTRVHIRGVNGPKNYKNIL